MLETITGAVLEERWRERKNKKEKIKAVKNREKITEVSSVGRKVKGGQDKKKTDDEKCGSKRTTKEQKRTKTKQKHGTKGNMKHMKKTFGCGR